MLPACVQRKAYWLEADELPYPTTTEPSALTPKAAVYVPPDIESEAIYAVGFRPADGLEDRTG